MLTDVQLSSAVLESSLNVTSSYDNFATLLGTAIEGDTWDSVKDTTDYVVQSLIKAINTLLVKIVDTVRKIKKENKGAYTCRKKYFTAATKIQNMVDKITEKTDPATVSAKIKEVNAEMKNDESKTTVNVSQGDITKKLAAIDKKLKKAKADLKKFRNKQITTTYSKAQKSNDIKRYRSLITVCNRAYSAWAQIVIHGMSKEHKN